MQRILTCFEEHIAKSTSAGMDIHVHDEPADIKSAVVQGLITEARIDESAKRIIAFQMKLGLFENRYVDAAKAVEIFNSNASAAIGLEAQRKSIVVLTKDGTMPLEQRVAYTSAVGKKVYAPDFDTATLSPHVFDKTPLSNPAGAEVIIVKLDSPKVKNDVAMVNLAFGPSLHMSTITGKRLLMAMVTVYLMIQQLISLIHHLISGTVK